MEITDKKYYSYHITRRFLKAMEQILGDRQQGKMTASSFGDIVGITSSNINRLRSSAGENTVTLEAVARMCEIYKVSPYWLLTGNGEIFTNAELKSAYESVESKVNDIEHALKGIEAALKILKSSKKKNAKG